MMRVTVTGSECTGKTTLARALADTYGCPCVPEFARQFVAAKGAPPEAGDVEAIARGQLALEDEVGGGAKHLLVLDTDLLSTWIYGHHYFGSCPEWIDAMVGRRRSDLYLLAGIDVPWSADGIQRDRGHIREAMQDLFRSELTGRGFRFVELEGLHAVRLAVAKAAVDRLLVEERG